MKIIISKFLFIYIGIFALIALLLTSCQDVSAETKTNVAAAKTEMKKEVKKTKSVADMNYEETAYALIQAVRTDMPTKKLTDKLVAANEEVLANELNSDNKKLAFWVNVYNSYINIILSENPEYYEDRGDFFGKEQVHIAGKKLSFDDIEHGIIRNSTMKLSKGYVGNPFPGKYEKMFRVSDRDPRIHFVLNCGAKDCPPVYAYNSMTLDADFNTVASTYLNKVSKYDAAKKEVMTTPLFNWFTGDWGGKDEIRDMLAQYNVIPANNDDIDVEYLDYDWTLDLDNFGDASKITASK